MLLHAQPWHQLAQLPQELTVADWGASIQLNKLILDKTIFLNCKIVRTQNPELSMPVRACLIHHSNLYLTSHGLLKLFFFFPPYMLKLL